MITATKSPPGCSKTTERKWQDRLPVLWHLYSTDGRTCWWVEERVHGICYHISRGRTPKEAVENARLIWDARRDVGKSGYTHDCRLFWRQIPHNKEDAEA